MKSQHPEFWNEIVGTWEVFPEGKSQAVTLQFSTDLKVGDASSFICGPEATPNYWTGETPAETVFAAEQPNRDSQGKGSAALQKMEFKRGQFMVVCNGKRMNYIDHIIFYDLNENPSGSGQKRRPVADAKWGMVKDEAGRRRSFAYRKLTR